MQQGGAVLLALRHFLLSLQFFTRIPMTKRLAAWVGFSPAMLRASTAHFPGVGWVVGVFTGLAFYGLLFALPVLPAAPWVAALVSTAFGVMITGALHEDGLADLADGLGGSQSRERALAIMKDSRMGSFGTIALVLILLCKATLLALLVQASDAVLVALALFAAHVTSRFMPLIVVRTLPYVGNAATSKSKLLVENLSNAGLLVGGLWWALAMALVAGLWPGNQWLWAVLVSALGLGWMWRLLNRRLQGFTGDGLGAVQQVCEVLFYLGLAVALPTVPAA